MPFINLSYNKEDFMEHSKRETSSSITHLVKVVAKEVFEENRMSILDDILNETNILFRKIDIRLTHQENIHPHPTKDHSGTITGRSYSFDRSGYDWSVDEDITLKREIRESLQEIAKKHRRSTGAISSRICQKNLLS